MTIAVGNFFNVWKNKMYNYIPTIMKMCEKCEIFLEKYKVRILAQEKLEKQDMPAVILEIEMYP